MGWVADDIIRNALVFRIIADDVVMKKGLPTIFKSQSVGVFGNGRFV